MIDFSVSHSIGQSKKPNDYLFIELKSHNLPRTYEIRFSHTYCFQQSLYENGFFFLHQTYIHSMRHTEDILISFEQRGLISFEQFLAKTKV